jgi:imidazoleglycerol-phosphate dehydratase/histidinol-phosphatase
MKENKGPILFIECDSLIVKPDKPFNFRNLNFQPSVFRGLSTIVDSSNFNLVLLLCCDDLDKKGISQEKKVSMCDELKEAFAREKIFFEKSLVDYEIEDMCPKFTIDNLNVNGYLNGNYDLDNSFIIGSNKDNIVLAKELKINSILYSSDSLEQDESSQVILQTNDWCEIANFLVKSDLKVSRKASVVRETKETKIKLDINLDGTGKSNINTNIKFFDHMLEQISRHSDIDIDLYCDGDIDVDEHHSVEDVAIALGSAISAAIGDKKGLTRYGFNNLVMDEVIATGAIDFSNRPYLVYNVPITREYIGSFPTEMFEHFFKSFSDSSKSTLHLSVSEGNSHHMIEAVYKCFAKCLKQALYVHPFSNKLPTTKGVL